MEVKKVLDPPLFFVSSWQLDSFGNAFICSVRVDLLDKLFECAIIIPMKNHSNTTSYMWAVSPLFAEANGIFRIRGVMRS